MVSFQQINVPRQPVMDRNRMSIGRLQRQCACGGAPGPTGECEACRQQREANTLQLSANHVGVTNAVPPIVQEVLYSPGQPLDAATRAFMEPRFGHDFSQVRVHTDGKASKSAHAVNALAYTVGRHVVFRAGQFTPTTDAGRGLLAHELAHVIQQERQSDLSKVPLQIGRPGAVHEQQAESAVKAIAVNRPAPTQPSAAPQLMRATRTFALTFDDGPHAADLGKGINRTEKVLDTLKAKGIKAGFFVQTGVSYRGASTVGRQLIARMHTEGHKVGIHTGGTTDHELHTRAQKAGRLESELEYAKKFISKETGETPTLVRPPTGALDKDVSATYATVSLTNLLWDMDGDQGKDLALKTLKDRIESEMMKVQSNSWKPSTPSPNIVVLYHDIQKGTADNLTALIEHIKTTTNTISSGKDNATFSAP
jgi:peptidoglycan/xylan/chitin deacetylase (PgdA/CDA1 family)